MPQDSAASISGSFEIQSVWVLPTSRYSPRVSSTANTGTEDFSLIRVPPGLLDWGRGSSLPPRHRKRRWRKAHARPDRDAHARLRQHLELDRDRNQVVDAQQPPQQLIRPSPNDWRQRFHNSNPPFPAFSQVPIHPQPARQRGEDTKMALPAEKPAKKAALLFDMYSWG